MRTWPRRSWASPSKRSCRAEKNLLIRFEDGRAIHIHLKMLGRVRVVDPAVLARMFAFRGAPMTEPQLRIDVDGAVILGAKIPVLALLKPGQEARTQDLVALGPDLLGTEFDEGEALKRLRAMGEREIGDALMQQQALAGIGNVYKSEIMFIEKVAPRAHVRSLDEDTLLRLMRRARKLLLANVGGGPRVTRSTIGARFYVYGRYGKRCFRCGSGIARMYQGAPPGRSTYSCPLCQKSPSA